MQGHGAHIILTREDAKRVFGAAGDVAVQEIANELRGSKRHCEAKLVLETGANWDAIHRCLTDGTLEPTAGEFPLNQVILGGKQLFKGAGFEAVMVRPDLTAFIAEALHNLKREEIHDKYMQLPAAELGYTPTEQESDIVWNAIQQIRQLFEDAAAERCAVMFTVER